LTARETPPRALPDAASPAAPATPVPLDVLAREPHRRHNPLLDEWVLTSAERTRRRIQRPWILNLSLIFRKRCSIERRRAGSFAASTL